MRGCVRLNSTDTRSFSPKVPGGTWPVLSIDVFHDQEILEQMHPLMRSILGGNGRHFGGCVLIRRRPIPRPALPEHASA